MGIIKLIGGLSAISAGLMLGAFGVSIMDGTPSGMMLTYGCIAAVIAAVLMRVG